MTTVMSTSPITSNNARRAERKRQAKAAKGSRNVPVVETHSHIGICVRCDRRGWVGAEGICVGLRGTDIRTAPFVPRATRCQEIHEQRLKREGRRDSDR